MATFVAYAALGCIAAGLLTGAVTLVLGRDLRGALRVALDFWLAAGMLRLTVATDWRPLAAAAALVLLRQLLEVSLHRTRRLR